jgi:hypothetical protein
VDYEPDVVISYGGGNDFHTPYQYDPRPGFPFDFVTLQIGTRALAGKLDLRSALASQLFKSRLITLILLEDYKKFVADAHIAYGGWIRHPGLGKLYYRRIYQ